jgi:SNF2 family DNA or RNA helicase
MRSAWGNELDAYFPWLSYSIADAKNRIEAFEIDTQIVVTNTDAAVTLAKNPKLLRGFDKLIIDESTSFKHASSQRSKAMRQISKQFKRRSLLTGTPNPNSVAELWHQMLILDGGQRLGPSFFRFRGPLVDTQRYELAADLIDQYKHSIVFFNWFHQREEMSKLLTARGVSFAMIDGSVKDSERHRIVNDFQAGRYQTVLLHPKTGAHGLTLTRGEACIILSPFYEADLLKQAIHRIYRGAQDKATNTILVQARNTVEGLVYGRLDEKTDNMNNFLELVVASQRRRAV